MRTGALRDVLGPREGLLAGVFDAEDFVGVVERAAVVGVFDAVEALEAVLALLPAGSRVEVTPLVAVEGFEAEAFDVVDVAITEFQSVLFTQF